MITAKKEGPEIKVSIDGDVEQLLEEATAITAKVAKLYAQLKEGDAFAVVNHIARTAMIDMIL